MGYVAILVLCILATSFIGNGVWAVWDDADPGDAQCDMIMQEVMSEDRATIVDNSPNRLDDTWISQECETKPGPEYIIRKYTFYENGTFLLMRHYYADESCSVATYTVTARGSIKLLGNSLVTPGATEARYQLDTVYISPLNRQVTHKLNHRVNVSCGPHQRWRPYMAHLIYESALENHRSSQSWQGPRYNSLGGPAMRGGKSVDCLAPLNIDFDELRLLIVQRRSTGFRSASYGNTEVTRVELYLGSLVPDPNSKRTHRPTALQTAILLRSDTIDNCPICGAIYRSTENSPPLLNEVVALPALLGGSWISPSCESATGGVWLRRQLRIYAGDKLWTGNWHYFNDPQCDNFVYGIAAAGSYVQRARRIRRHDAGSFSGQDAQQHKPEVWTRNKRETEEKIDSSQKDVDTDEIQKQISADRFREALDKFLAAQRLKRNVDEIGYYQQLLTLADPAMAESFAAMLRGNQRNEETTKKPLQSATPTGTTELDLHVAESVLVIGDPPTAERCGIDLAKKTTKLSNWPSKCVPHSLGAPSTLSLKARINMDWYGQYMLQLGPRDSGVWYAPLLQCGSASLKNPVLRAHLRRSVGLRFGILFSASSQILPGLAMLLVAQMLVMWFSVYATR